MNKIELINLFKTNPIILGIKSKKDFIEIENNPSKIVFTLFGDVSNIIDIINILKLMDKHVFISVDMVSGLSSQNSVIDFLINNTEVDGIISSKPQLLSYARKKGLFTIHRFFIIDSSSWRSIEHQINISKSDIINITPGWPKIVNWTVDKYDAPVISSGLVCDRATVIENLQAGAIAICTTNHDVWNLH